MDFNSYRNSVLGKAFDLDLGYGAQCWDGYADYCVKNGVPYANCTKTGYAMDIWEQRQTNGILNYFNEILKELCQPGDVITFRESPSCPDSHIGMCASEPVNGLVLVLGQNQGGPGGAFNEVWLPLSDAYPTVFRLKAKKLSQLDGNCQPVNDKGLRYCAHTQDIGWREWIHDGMIAGSVGAGKRLEALKIDTSKIDGLHLDAKVHIQDVGWVTFPDVRPDTVIGTVGRRLRIEAIELCFSESNTFDGRLMYQVHLADTGWTGRVPAGYATGTVGLSKAIEAIKIWTV